MGSLADRIGTSQNKAHPKCSKCQSTNVIGPFEMDGYADGKYQVKGLRWIVCRECNCATRSKSSLA